MRKSVKYVAALLAATMTIGGLTGCGLHQKTYALGGRL